MKLICSIFLLAFVSLSHAETYYIDWDSGDDTNNGTSTNSPWKRHPDMNGWLGGSFTAQPGDRFILKGGVTWPNEACTLYIQDNGTEANRIYIGIDTNWYSGDQWVTWTNGNGILQTNFNYPTLDAQGIQISDTRTFINISSTRNNVVIVNGDYITLEGLKIMGVLINDNPAGGGPNPDAGTDHTLRVHNATSFRGIGMYLCDWVVETTLGGDVGGAIASGGSTDTRLINSRIKGPENIDAQWITAGDGRDYGNAIQFFSRVQGCDISRVGQGIWNCSVVESNIVHTMGRYIDADAHENALWSQATRLIRNNIFRDIDGGVGAYLLPGWGGRSNHKQFVFNNLFWNTPQINLSQQASPDESNEIWFFNNVVRQPGETCIQVGTTKSGAAFKTLVIQNNVFISASRSDDDAGMVKIIDASDLGSQYTNSHNVFLSSSTATALGLLEGNLWEPQDELAALVDQGVDASGYSNPNTNSITYLPPTNDFLGVLRPQGAEWDIGAYEFTEGDPSPGSLTLSSSTYAVGEIEGTVTITVNRFGGTEGSVGVTYATTDITAETGSDYIGATNTVAFANGEDTKDFTIPITGDEDVEGNETFRITLSDPTGGATLGGITEAIVTIIDDDFLVNAVRGVRIQQSTLGVGVGP